VGIIYQFHTARTTISDNQLVKKYVDINKY